MKNRGMSEIVIRGVVCQVVGWTCQLFGLPTGNSDQALQEKQEGGKTTNQRIGRNVGKVLLCAKWVGWVGGSQQAMDCCNSDNASQFPRRVYSSAFSFLP